MPHWSLRCGEETWKSTLDPGCEAGEQVVLVVGEELDGVAYGGVMRRQQRLPAPVELALSSRPRLIRFVVRTAIHCS